MVLRREDRFRHNPEEEEILNTRLVNRTAIAEMGHNDGPIFPILLRTVRNGLCGLATCPVMRLTMNCGASLEGSRLVRNSHNILICRMVCSPR